MRLRTIWTSGYPLSEKLHRTSEWFWREFAHRLPRRLAYWSFIDTGVRHIRHDEVVPDVTYTVLLQRVGQDVTS